MTLVAGENLSKKYNDRIILDNVSFSVNSGECIGLVGRNGSGKTTLLDLICNRNDPDSGKVTLSGQCRIDYVMQDKSEFIDSTLVDFVSGARPELSQTRIEIGRVEEYLTSHPNDTQAVDNLGKLQHEFEVSGGYSFDNEVKTILTGLGFEETRHNESLKRFSGGEKNRAALARALAGVGNLLILDEPTNHLDIESTLWLEDYLQNSQRTYLVVSHDRAFLTATVKQVWEITFGKIDTFQSGFEQFLVDRDERRRLHAHRYRHQQMEIKRLEEFIRRNMAGQKTRQAQSKLKYLDRMDKIPPPKSEADVTAMRIESSGRSYAHTLSLKEVSLGYGGRLILSDLNLDLYRGDKLGVVGRNGSGKTTLLKALTGELVAIAGEIKLGANLDVAYFDQELAELDVDLTILETIWQIDQTAQAGTIRSYLGRYGFSGEEVLKKVAALSGGEKTKLALAKLLYRPANFLILDEPTNNLDIDSRETLERALIAYDGSLLVVSHDRYFLDRVSNKILHIDRETARLYDGNYSYFRDKVTARQAVASQKPTKDNTSYLAFKKQSRQKSRLKKQLKSLRSRIADHEKELQALVADISDKIPKSNWEKLHDATRRKTELEDKILSFYSELEGLEETKEKDSD